MRRLLLWARYGPMVPWAREIVIKTVNFMALRSQNQCMLAMIIIVMTMLLLPYDRTVGEKGL